MIYEWIIQKPVNFWLALWGAALFVYYQHRDLPIPHRLLIVTISVSLAASTYEALGERYSIDPHVVLIVLTVFGYLLLNVIGLAIKSPEFKSSLLHKLGIRSKDGGK